ncbi:hypothetical protein [Shewanella aestuarii]|uniref:Uncharacterized protein n=1 Tax=Shewanella aestuarii TaxID=1028752 RepID=A0A6G9QLF4_9GAMM|nr:hypothetical protein [Shewanella aestuarii]QIR15410.1 hypothetical protein HBH39_13645 [Shewanella aestuarii]
MSSDIASEENLISRLWHITTLKTKESIQLLCLIAILSTYIFALLTPKGLKSSKASGSH